MKPEAADGEVVARAEGLRRETPGLTFGEAVDRVLDDEPSLYSLVPEAQPVERERTHVKPDPERATPQQPQAFAERVALDEARERAKAKGIAYLSSGSGLGRTAGAIQRGRGCADSETDRRAVFRIATLPRAGLSAMAELDLNRALQYGGVWGLLSKVAVAARHNEICVLAVLGEHRSGYFRFGRSEQSRASRSIGSAQPRRRVVSCRHKFWCSLRGQERSLNEQPLLGRRP